MLKLNTLNNRQAKIIDFLSDGSWIGATQIINELSPLSSSASIKRDLKELYVAGIIEQQGKARATKYRRAQTSKFLGSVDLNKYFTKTQEDRGKQIPFNANIFSELAPLKIFDTGEKKHLTELLKEYRQNIKNISANLLKKEFERVTIDLSWKSSAIEGNTYTLLETETLLKEGIPAPGKTGEETAMLINHKKALEFIRNNSQEFKILTISQIEEVHSILIKDLSISRNVRKRIVGITGTNYKPLDNEFQIKESLEDLCKIVNKSDDVFVKSLLAILLISYIQPFEDGNKRTARLIGNALLLAYDGFPLSFRSVDPTHYKKAMLLFYEINNLSEFKKLFIDQAEFAVKEYFR